MLLFLSSCPSSPGATNETAWLDDLNAPVPSSPGENARELYNAGTLKLRAGKWGDAEVLLQSAIAKQDGRVQPEALFNLGHVRFGQGKEELKKSPDPAATSRWSRAADQVGAGAIQGAEDALAREDVQQMVQAYLAGRGARREMHEALAAVQRALTAHGQTLLKWRRALGDFQSAAELNAADTNAARNAEIVEQAIARLVDSLREVQQSASGLGRKQTQLGELLKALRGRIPAADMPPGAAGQGEEDQEGEDERILPEALAGMQESTSGGGQETGPRISPESAGQLLNGIQPDGKLLPMAEGQTGKPKDRSGRIW